MSVVSSFKLESLSNGWLVGRFPILDDWGVLHMVTTKQGPDVQRVASDTYEMGSMAAQVMGIDSVAWLTQVHQGQVLRAKHGGGLGEADALFTDSTGLALVGKSADCPLVLVVDPVREAVGFAHASWRSTVAGITTNLIKRMQTELGCHPEHMVACICPSAGPECYEVGSEVKENAIGKLGNYAGDFFQPGDRDKFYFDLWQANINALIRCGFKQEKIVISNICTICRSDLFPSYRREASSAGRFMAIIGLPTKIK